MPHNFDICKEEMLRVSHEINIDVQLANSDPSKHVVWLAGDWNFLPVAEFPKSASNPTPDDRTMIGPRINHLSDGHVAEPPVIPTTSTVPTINALRPAQRAWEHIHGKFIELAQPLPTHF